MDKGKPLGEIDPVTGKRKGGFTGKGWPKGVSGNPGGPAKKFTTLLSDAIRNKLGEVDVKTKKTYAELIAGGMVQAAADEVAKGRVLSKNLLQFLGLAGDMTEGKPTQKVELVDKSGDPGKRAAELLVEAASRAASVSKPEGTE